MVRRPTKAPEAGPFRGFVARKADGTPLNVADLIHPDGFSEPFSRVPAIFSGGQMHPELPERWQEIFSDVANLRARQKALGSINTKALEAALKEYRYQRLRELEAPAERDVKEALRKIEAATTKLLDYANRPRSNPAAFLAAWHRLRAARAPYEEGSRDPHDEIYPILSLMDARFRAMQNQSRKSVPAASLVRLIHDLARIVESAGGRATASRGIISKSGPELSSFCMFVKAALLRCELPAPCALTDAALSQAVLRALKSRSQ